MESIRGTHRVLLEIHQPRPPPSFGAELLTLFNGYSASHRVARFLPNGGSKSQSISRTSLSTPTTNGVSIVDKKKLRSTVSATLDEDANGHWAKTERKTAHQAILGLGTTCTHRVRVENAKDVDAEWMGGIREAYEAAG